MIWEYTESQMRNLCNVPRDAELLMVLEHLPLTTKEGPWVSGSAVRKMLIGQPIDTDIDLFFSSQAQFDIWDGYMKEVTKGTVQPMSTPNQKTYHYTIDDKSYKIQLITKRWYSDRKDLLDSFDFTICQFLYDSEGFAVGQHSLNHLKAKELVIHKVTYPISTFRRFIKYVNEGFMLPNDTILEFLDDYKECDYDPSEEGLYGDELTL